MNLNAIYVYDGFTLNAVESIRTLPTVPPVSLHINGKPITLTHKREGYEFMCKDYMGWEGDPIQWVREPINDPNSVISEIVRSGPIKNVRFIITDEDLLALEANGIIDMQQYNEIIRLEVETLAILIALGYKSKKLGEE
jgi:hypothetical protein